jgi:rhodanese-related sulfurtransferase
MRKLALFCLFLILPSLAAAADYPLRAKFPQATPISTEMLLSQHGKAVVVDVRTQMEYDVAHVKDAALLPVDESDFLAQVGALRGKSDTAALVFYCNGALCAKSYKAAEIVTAAGFGNAFVYDAGIMTWLKTHPEKTVFLGRTPADPKLVIDDEAFKKRLIDFPEFSKRALEPNTIIIDIRDDSQRSVNADLPQNQILVIRGAAVQNIASDRFAAFIKAEGFKNKQLLVVDAVGVQIRWAQYFLEEHGYTNYAFLKGGVKAAVESGALKK